MVAGWVSGFQELNGTNGVGAMYKWNRCMEYIPRRIPLYAAMPLYLRFIEKMIWEEEGGAEGDVRSNNANQEKIYCRLCKNQPDDVQITIYMWWNCDGYSVEKFCLT